VAITVVGSVALDTIETPFGARDDVLGGAASYFSMAASLYTGVNLVAVVGGDFPDRYRAYFAERHINQDGMRTVEGETFRWGGRYHLDMNTRDTLFTKLGVFADFDPVLPEQFRRSPITFLANIQPQLQLNVLKQTQSQLRALDTMNLWIDTARETLEQVIRGVDLVLIAEEEARDFVKTPSLRAAARAILALGPRMLVVKQGSYGALLFGADGSFFAAPAYPLEDVRDPTGAGDAFAGGFLGYLASRIAAAGDLTSADYRRALIHGNIMGSFACEEFGLERVHTLTPERVTARYDEFVRFTHFEGSWHE